MVVNQPSMCYACPMNLDPDICRSLLFVPTGNEPYLDSTLRGTANVIQLDLEDSISCDQKSQSRAGAHAAINRIHESGRVGVVRINNDQSLLSADLDAVVGPQLAGITLPKVSCGKDCRNWTRLSRGSSSSASCQSDGFDWSLRSSPRQEY